MCTINMFDKKRTLQTSDLPSFNFVVMLFSPVSTYSIYCCVLLKQKIHNQCNNTFSHCLLLQTKELIHTLGRKMNLAV
jgi:hypothetical protein